MARNTRFGVFKSQNFSATPLSLSVLTASLEERYISQVVDSRGQIKSMVAALCEALSCRAEQLEQRLADYSFAIRVGEELFVRSIARIDYARERIHLFCDVAPGEELVMVKRTSLVDTTRQDFARFLQGKSGTPLVGVLNDCILRRANNGAELPRMGEVFGQTPVVGFSTFGEILGLNLNQTLTAVFFFRTPEGAPFRDDYVDNFAAHYGEFKAFFLRRQIKKLAGLSQVVVNQINEFKRQNFTGVVDAQGLDDSIQAVFGGLADLGQVLRQAHQSRQEIGEQLRHYSGELHSSMDDLAGNILQQGEVTRQADSTVQHLTEQAEDVVRSANELSQSSLRIQSIVQVIQQIAGQTNLLALNAAIEARAPARAVAASRWWPTRCATWRPSLTRTPPRSAPTSTSCPAPSARSVPISPARPRTWARCRSSSPSCANPVAHRPDLPSHQGHRRYPHRPYRRHVVLGRKDLPFVGTDRQVAPAAPVAAPHQGQIPVGRRITFRVTAGSRPAPWLAPPFCPCQRPMSQQ